MKKKYRVIYRNYELSENKAKSYEVQAYILSHPIEAGKREGRWVSTIHTFPTLEDAKVFIRDIHERQRPINDSDVMFEEK